MNGILRNQKMLLERFFARSWNNKSKWLKVKKIKIKTRLVLLEKWKTLSLWIPIKPTHVSASLHGPFSSLMYLPLDQHQWHSGSDNSLLWGLSCALWIVAASQVHWMPGNPPPQWRLYIYIYRHWERSLCSIITSCQEWLTQDSTSSQWWNPRNKSQFSLYSCDLIPNFGVLT